MTVVRSGLRKLVQIIILTFACWNGFSQELPKTVITGLVKDSETGQPLPFVSVILKNTTIGTVTDSKGFYKIETTGNHTIITFSFLGYEAESRPVTPGRTQTVNISLIPVSFALKEVVVKPEREHYTNKGNPAVELIKKVIENKSVNRKEGFDYLGYEKYDKTQFALSNIGKRNKEQPVAKKFSFVFDNIDTVKEKGKENLPFYIKETLSDCYFRRNPEGEKEIIKGEKSIDINEYFDSKGVAAYIGYLYQNINIYDNNILFLTNKFLSPVASEAPLFYRYFVIDTVRLSDVPCVKLFFEPRNETDFLFQGYLYITRDERYAIKRIEMNINHRINIDWVKDIKIMQDFVEVQDKTWMLSKDEISIDFGITERSLGIFGQRMVSYTNYHINEPLNDTLFTGPKRIEKLDPGEKNAGYWELNRHFALTKTEQGIYSMYDTLRTMPAFRHRMYLLMFANTGLLTYKDFDIGPVGSMYSYNPVEGSRIRLGGQTNPDFSKKIFLDGYVAYGFNDNKYKYSLGATYSLTPRTIYQFPVKSLRVSYTDDTRVPGQEFQFTQGDYILYSFKRGTDDKLLYNKTFKTEFLNEYENHFSFTLGYTHTVQSPAGTLHFNYNDYLSPSDDIHNINISEAYVNLRYAPDETFYQNKIYRDPMPNEHPVIQLKYSIGSKSIGNDYDYSRIQLSVSKRTYLSILGYTDVTLEAGKIFGTVPYPLLFIHHANQTYSYQISAYNLMNFLEFVSDQYGSVNIDHCFNGFFLNKIPLLKEFKLRELVTFKALFGGLGNNNNPSLNSGLFKFPADILDTPLTYHLNARPYIEAGVGISNIFKILRVDLVKRITYTNNPGVSALGLRVQMKIDI